MKIGSTETPPELVELVTERLQVTDRAQSSNLDDSTGKWSSRLYQSFDMLSSAPYLIDELVRVLNQLLVALEVAYRKAIGPDEEIRSS